MTVPPPHPSEPEWRACAVCSRVLARKDEYVRDEYVGTHWEHEAIDIDRGVDHPPVPVPFSQLASIAMVCDFCSTPDPLWELPVADFTIARFYSNGDDWGSTNNWTACEICADLIKRSLWPQLTTRAIDHMISNSKLPRTREVRAVVQQDIERKYALVRKHQQGPIQLMERAITIEAIRQIVEGKHRSDALGGAHEDPDLDR